MAELFLLSLLGFLLWFWFNTVTVRDRAVAAARDTCSRQNLQLLDGSVALRALSLRRTRHGNLSLRRTFVFAYSSTGMDRQTGFVITVGNHVDQVGL